MGETDKKCFGYNKRLNKFLILILVVFVLTVTISECLLIIGNENLAISKNENSSAIVIEQSTKRILYGENIDIKLPMASTTKIMTALVVLENVEDIDKKMKVPKEAIGVEGSSIYLKCGETLTYRDLLYGLLLRSGNDSAVALAVLTAGSIEKFAFIMNETAQRIGAVNSHFVNPHGLHDDNHYTTAYDLALITCEAMNNPTFCEIISTKSVKISNGEEPRFFQNKNKMLRLFEGANGVKTGFTKKSGRCLVSSAKRDGMQLIGVVLNHGAMWQDSMDILNKAFENYKMRNIFELEDYQTLVPVIYGMYPYVIATPEKTMRYPLTNEEFYNLKIEYKLDKNLRAPVKANKKIGEICVYSDNRLLFKADFITMHSVKLKILKRKFFKKTHAN